jgi:hypothetical protein
LRLLLETATRDGPLETASRKGPLLDLSSTPREGPSKRSLKTALGDAIPSGRPWTLEAAPSRRPLKTRLLSLASRKIPWDGPASRPQGLSPEGRWLIVCIEGAALGSVSRAGLQGLARGTASQGTVSQGTVSRRRREALFRGAISRRRLEWPASSGRLEWRSQRSVKGPFKRPSRVAVSVRLGPVGYTRVNLGINAKMRETLGVSE